MYIKCVSLSICIIPERTEQVELNYNYIKYIYVGIGCICFIYVLYIIDAIVYFDFYRFILISNYRIYRIKHQNLSSPK